jgi:hypothetical protein
MRVIWVIAVLTGILRAASPPTFYKGVLPVLERECQNCHRVGKAAPMALVTKKMPPWVADPAAGHFPHEVPVMDPMDLYRPARKRSE